MSTHEEPAMPADQAALESPTAERYVLLFRGGRSLSDEERERVQGLPSLHVVSASPFSTTFLVELRATEEDVRRDLDALGIGPTVLSVQRRYALL